MTLPLRVYKTVNNLQLLISVYAVMWLIRFFTASISCNMIENRISTDPYLLRYGDYFLPVCTSGGEGLSIGLWDSLLLRVVFIAWVVVSLFVLMRIRRIRTYVAVSEPVEFIKKKQLGKDGRPIKGSEGEGESLISDFTDMFPKFQVSRIMKIVFAVSSVWIVLLLLLQGPIVEYFNRYAEEKRFNGEIQDFNVRFSKDGVASISLFVDGNPILLRSDRNIDNLAELSKDEDGVFEGFESYILDDPLLPQCLEGARVDVFARRSGVYYSLDGSDYYYVKFLGGAPTCQNIYMNRCVFGGDSVLVGETINFEDEDIICRCNVDGLSCLEGTVGADSTDKDVCEYHGGLYASGTDLVSEDGCSSCTCTNGKLTCTQVECPATEYDLSNPISMPIYYWFVDEPEPSDVVTVTAGRSDSFDVVAYKPFGQSPKTELTLLNGRAKLIFSTAYTQGTTRSAEVKPIEGNDNYSKLVRYYSISTGGYAYGEMVNDSECVDDPAANGNCLQRGIGGIFVECVSDTGDYGVCDAVMSTFSIE